MFKRSIGVFLVLCCLVFTAACPVSPASLAQAKSSSAKVASYANAGVNLTRELYGASFLTLAQKDAIAKKFIVLADAGIAFDAAVAAVEAQYGSDTAPKSEIQRLMAVFDARVVEAFLDVLTSLKVIPSKGNYAATIELIRVAVLTVAGIFGLKRQVATKIEAAA